MLRTLSFSATLVLVALWATAVLGQGTGNRTSVTGLGNSAGTGTSSGLQQTGQITSDAAISRDANAFVGGTQGNILSRGGGTTGSTSSLGSALGGLSRMGMGSYGMMGGMGRGGFGNMGMNRMNQGMGNTANQQTVRSTLRLGFQIRRPTSNAITSRFVARLPRIPGLEAASGVGVKMDGQTAVLQGAVASQRQADLIERLALLEPGISDVRNELRVAAADALPESPTGASAAESR